MVKVTFVQSDGSEQTIEGVAGRSLMEAALANGIPRILADCGGSCSCGTCRVFIADEWQGKAGGPNDLEVDMLEMHADRHEGERLSCQLTLTDDLDGLVVTVPESQF